MNSLLQEESRQPGQAGRGASGGWPARSGGRAGGPAAGRGRSGQERKDNRSRQNLPCAFYNLELVSGHYYYYYYTPIQATVGLGAFQQRFYESLPTRPILALCVDMSTSIPSLVFLRS